MNDTVNGMPLPLLLVGVANGVLAVVLLGVDWSTARTPARVLGHFSLIVAVACIVLAPLIGVSS